MRRRFFGIAGTALIGLGLGGCAQMTRHSNTLVFGTNTSFGIKVGTDATNTPGVTVGYSRQEAVVMPLVANTDDDGRVQKPCPKPNTAMASPVLDASCVLVGRVGEDSDAYSVMASFGAKFDANGKPGEADANGEIAQYFATGLAARTLAERAGAAAIATGPSVQTSFEAQAQQSIDTKDKLAAAVAGKVAALNPGLVADVAPFLLKLDQGAESGSRFRRACDGLDKDKCAANIRDRQGLTILSVTQWEKAGAINP